MAENYILLERIELNASASSVTFSNIPQSGYTDLKIVCSARSERATVQDTFKLTFNATGSGYSFKRIYGDGTNAASDGSTGDTTLTGGYSNGNSSTANTFGNTEFYIPNYTSSNYKSVSVDGVGETNATTIYAGMFASLWANTAAITSIKIEGGTGANLMQYSTFSLYSLAAVGTTPSIAPKASGGNITTDGTYWYHTFLTSGTFTPATNLTCDYLVVAGGGGSGDNGGGGGGGGGLRSTVTATGGGGSLESPLALTSSTAYTVTVGSGGAAGISGSSPTSGSNSVFATITSTGGGYGGGYVGYSQPGASGGSGGGGNGNGSNAGGAASPSGQGYAGGAGVGAPAPYYRTSGGGGGAGAAGTAGTGSGQTGGNGGNGIYTALSDATTSGQLSSAHYYLAGGGGGVGASANGSSGLGGAGTPSTNSTGGNGTANTGGGAGGAGGNGGNGGSGIVIVRYSAA